MVTDDHKHETCHRLLGNEYVFVMFLWDRVACRHHQYRDTICNTQGTLGARVEEELKRMAPARTILSID
jgi:hypothetical protein